MTTPAPAPVFDLLVIGGGINGVGIARDAAGRGHRVALVEAGDLAGATSSASSKLIHGGLRYLEHGAFRLVRESLAEREHLLRIAPHIVRPLRFVLPVLPGMRPAPLLRLGLFLYDHLGGPSALPGTRSLDLEQDVAGAGLRPGPRRAFEYTDLWAEDSRLVVLNALDARERGASVFTRARVVQARREAQGWCITLEGGQKLHARVLVNATGPWVGEVARDLLGLTQAPAIRKVQGSHIVLERLFAHDRAYTFQNTDGRVVFALPFEERFTLVGTTDRDVSGDPRAATASEAEIAYLLEALGRVLANPPRRADVVTSFAGVRPLMDDGASRAQEATREYHLHLDAPAGAAPVLSVYGGKLTTYRRLALAALETLGPHLPPAIGLAKGWTALHALPGGDFSTLAALESELVSSHPFLPAPTRKRLARTYGTRALALLEGAKTPADLGRDVGAGLSEREVDYLRRVEWAQNAQDILYRRTRLHLHMQAEERAALESLFG